MYAYVDNVNEEDEYKYSNKNWQSLDNKKMIHKDCSLSVC